MKRLTKLFCGVLLSGVTVLAHAWPTKPVTLVVPFAPGGLADQISRVVAKDITLKTNTPVVVTNVPGAEGLVAMREQLNKSNDGHTFIFVTDSFVAGPWFIDNDTTRQFDLITVFSKQPLVLVGPPNSNLNALNTKNSATVGVVGLESPHSYWLRGIRSKTEFVQVPYKGANPVMNDIMGGHIDYAVVSLGFARQFVDAGRANILMLSTEQPLASSPNIPTFRQAGFTGPAASTWYGFIARSGQDPQHVAEFNRLLQEVIRTNAELDKMRSQGLEFVDIRGKQAQEVLAAEVQRFGTLRVLPLK